MQLSSGQLVASIHATVALRNSLSCAVNKLFIAGTKYWHCSLAVNLRKTQRSLFHEPKYWVARRT